MRNPNAAELANHAALAAPVYIPGRPESEVAEELGIAPGEIVKLASNENPLGISPRAREAVVAVLARQNRYPEGSALRLRERIAGELGLGVESVVCGNGSNELLELAVRIFGGPGRSLVHGEYGFIVYRLAALHSGTEPISVAMPAYKHDLVRMREAVRGDTRLVCVASPNNPTGVRNANEELDSFLESLPPGCIAILDEAYRDYVENPHDLLPHIRAGRPVLGMRTFSKIHGLAGFRVGYAYGRSDLIELLARNRDPFNVNAPAQVAALASLDDTEFLRESQRVNRDGLVRLSEILDSHRIPYVPSEANFLMARVADGNATANALLREGVIIRPLAGYGLTDQVRISVGLPLELQRLDDALGRVLATAAGRNAIEAG